MARGAHLIAPFSIFLLSMLARLAAIGRYVTPDELNWVYRSLGLRRALLAADWQNTLQSGHPGVTTTWIGAVAAQLQLWLQPQSQAHLAWLERLQQLSTENVEAYRHLYAFLTGGRLGVSLVVSLTLVLIYMLSRQLIGTPAALLAALLLALDPFFAGLSGLMHLDGLLAVFTLAALLLALRAHSDSTLAAAAASGLFTALALLTKTPGLLLAVLVPGILLLPVLSDMLASRKSEGAAPLRVRFRRPATRLVAWGATMVIVLLLLLPALWAAPGHVLEVVRGLSGRLISDAVRPTFFMGKMALDHGPLYYPVVVLIRLSPVAFAGLLLALPRILTQRDATAAHVRWLVIFALLFLVAITFAAKKFDRYALPSLVILTLTAAWGLAQFVGSLRHNGRRLLLVALAVHASFLLTVWPHPLAAANWILGGAVTARRILPSAWGEDAGMAARQLSRMVQQPQDARLFSSSLTGTAPFFAGEIVRLNAPNLTRLREQDYILILPEDRRLSSLAIPELAPTVVPVRGMGTAILQTGLDPSALQLPPLFAKEVAVRFGPALHLQAGGSSFLPWPEETIVSLTWMADHLAGLSSAYRLQLELRDQAGQSWLQREFALLNGNDHAPLDWPGGEPQTVFYTIQLPPTLAPGSYSWVLRTFDAEERQQAVYDASGVFAGTQASVAAMTVTAPPEQPMLEAPNPLPTTAPIAGHARLPSTAMAGDPFSLELWWRALESWQEARQITFVLDMDGHRQEATLDLAGTRVGQLYRLRPVWRLPLALASGPQSLSLSVRDSDTGQLAGGPWLLGSINVETRERLYSLPPGVEPMQIAVEQLALLQDISVEVQDQVLSVRVVWEARETTLRNYTTFVHLREGEQVIVGDDRQPDPPTSSWAPGEIIVETYTLPRPSSGQYGIALGLYDAENGARLPLTDEGGQRLPDDQFLLTVEIP